MQKDDLWLLDAHCDSFEMRHFLNNQLDFVKDKHVLSAATRNMLVQMFKDDLPKKVTANYHVTFSRLQKGNVRALFLNCGDFDLSSSSIVLDAAYQMVQTHSDQVVICYNSNDVKQTIQSGKLALILSAEGASMFNKLASLRNTSGEFDARRGNRWSD